jgi:hypothetical protein
LARRRRSYARTRTVYRKAKRVYRSRGGGGAFKPFINGAIAGVAAEAGQKFLGQWGAPVGVGAVGYFMKDNTLKTIAGLQIGSIVGDMLPVIGGGGRTMGGAY